ncbi:hypothetical protein CJF34_13750 [Pseudomonas lundensis]|nr:hypothetical protein CJF34_13750 [Pseudomonas lundensis]
MKLQVSPRAARDLQEIALYIVQDNPQRAMSFIGELRLSLVTYSCGAWLRRIGTFILGVGAHLDGCLAGARCGWLH